MIIGLYAALLAFFGFFLSMRVVRMRWKYRVSLGPGGKGQEELLQNIRAHANFFEYVPFAVVLLALLELSLVSVTLLHVLGSILVVARVSHFWGLIMISGPSKFRFLGMLFTFLVLLVSACHLLWQYTWNFLQG